MVIVGEFPAAFPTAIAAHSLTKLVTAQHKKTVWFLSEHKYLLPSGSQEEVYMGSPPVRGRGSPVDHAGRLNLVSMTNWVGRDE